MPAIPMEKVLDYSLVPTYLKSQADVVAQMQAGGGGEDDEDDETDSRSNANASRATITPAILVLTARTFDGDDDDDEAGASIKHLKVVRCPAVDMSNWVFEVGTLPEPRLAREFLPGASNVTVRIVFLFAFIFGIYK